MKITVQFTQDEIKRLVAQRAAELFQVAAQATDVKTGPYSWDGYTVEVDDSKPAPEVHGIMDDLGNEVA